MHKGILIGAFLGLLGGFLPYSLGQEVPILLDEEKILHLPLAEFRSGGSVVYFTADLKASDSFDVFTPVSAELLPDYVSGTVELDQLIESDITYEGVTSILEPGTLNQIGPFQSCPTVPFNPGNTSIEIKTAENSIQLSIDVFPDLTCELSGSWDSAHASGTFQCSDFNNGEWESTSVSISHITSLFSANLQFVGNSCSFDALFTGLKKQ